MKRRSLALFAFRAPSCRETVVPTNKKSSQPGRLFCFLFRTQDGPGEICWRYFRPRKKVGGQSERSRAISLQEKTPRTIITAFLFFLGALFSLQTRLKRALLSGSRHSLKLKSADRFTNRISCVFFNAVTLDARRAVCGSASRCKRLLLAV